MGTGQLTGLVRLPALVLAAGRTDSLVVAAAKLAEKELEGEVVGLLHVGLWAGTLEHSERVREGSGEGRRPGVDTGQGDNELLLEGDQLTHLWYKRAATGPGCDVNKWISHLCIMKNSKRINIILDSSI